MVGMSQVHVSILSTFIYCGMLVSHIRNVYQVKHHALLLSLRNLYIECLEGLAVC